MISVAAPANAVIGSPWRSGLPNGWSAIRSLSRITTEKSRYGRKRACSSTVAYTHTTKPAHEVRSADCYRAGRTRVQSDRRRAKMAVLRYLIASLDRPLDH